MICVLNILILYILHKNIETAVLVCGCLVLGLAFLAMNLKGTITQVIDRFVNLHGNTISVIHCILIRNSLI